MHTPRTRIALILSILLVGMPSARAAEPAAKVRLGTLAPRGSSYFRHMQAMGEQWRTAGVSLTIYPDGTMGSEADMVRRMRLGQLQAGMLTVVGLEDIEPAVAGLQNIPMLFRSLDEADHVGAQLHPLLEQKLAAKGFIVLGWTDTGWVRFFAKQKILRPDDLRRTKLFVWAGSPASVDLYRSVGCTAIPLETADILPGLRTGLIDAVPLPPTIALAGQVDSVAPHMTELNWAPLAGALVMSRKAWDALPAVGRDAVRAAASATCLQIKRDGRRESDESVQAMRGRGLQVHTVPEDVLAEWRREVEPTYPRIRGTLVPADIFDEVMRQLQAYRSQPAPSSP